MMKTSCILSASREFFFLSSIEVNSSFLPFLTCGRSPLECSTLPHRAIWTHRMDENFRKGLLLDLSSKAGEDKALLRVGHGDVEAVLLRERLAHLERVVEVLRTAPKVKGDLSAL